MITTAEAISPVGAVPSAALFPTFGYFDRQRGAWRIRVQGQVSQSQEIDLRRRILVRLLRRAMHAPPHAFNTALFHERIEGFLVAGQRGRRLVARIDDRVYPLRRRSRRSGHFSDTVAVPADAFPPEDHFPGDAIPLEVIDPDGGDAPAVGRAHLIGPTGLSVVSDIDDTIKHSHVVRKRELLRNTFLRPFEPIAGMAELYGRWAEAGAAFHYVSSSPWQLYRPLETLRREAGFPAGAYHLRSFRLTTDVLRKLLLVRARGKAHIIHSLLRAFPRRRFLLVGDSGERDPEIYGALARRRPFQVAAVLIRNLPERPVDPARRRRAFRQVPEDLVQIFEHPHEVADRPPRFVSGR